MIASQKPRVPPLNFAMILPGVYRSGHPNKNNFPFMESLNLVSIMYLSTDVYRPDTHAWAVQNKLKIYQFKFQAPKYDEMHEIPVDVVRDALEVILDKRNLPILIHDNKGRFLPSIISSLLHLLQGWTFSYCLQDYRAFLPDEKQWLEGEGGKPERGRERGADLEFIDTFPLDTVKIDPRYRPDWLDPKLLVDL